MKNKKWLITAAILAGLAVAAGAFGAHGLKKLVEPQSVETFKTGAQYQFYHALAIAVIIISSQFINNQWIRSAAWCFVVGIILFSGSLYLIVMGKAQNTEGFNWLGPITPIGGIFFLLGWGFFAWGIHKGND